MAQINIRPAIPDDAKAIANLWNPMIRDSAVTFTSAQKTTSGLAQQIKDCNQEGRGFFLAEDSQGLMGFCTYFQFRGGPGYARTMEHSIILAERARGQGLGQKLMQTLIGHARNAGVHTLWAGVSGENPSGIAFHKSIGFTQIAVLPQVGRKFDRWMDLVLLQKFL